MFRKSKTTNINNDSSNKNKSSDKSKDKNVKSSTVDTTTRPTQSQASIITSLQEKKSGALNVPNYLVDVKNILNSLSGLQLINPKDMSQSNIMRQNVDDYINNINAYYEFFDYYQTSLDQSNKELLDRNKILMKELNAMHFDKPFRLHISTLPKKSLSKNNINIKSKNSSTNNINSLNNNKISSIIEKDQGVTFSNIEVKLIELFQKITLVTAEDNKSNSYILSLQKCIESLIATIKGNTSGITLIAEMYSIYADILSTSEAVDAAIIQLLEFMKDKSPKDLGTTFYIEFSTQLNTINNCLDQLKKYRASITDEMNSIIKLFQPSIIDLKNQVELNKVQLETLKNVSTSYTYKEVFGIMKSSHLILSALVGTAEIMYRDILKHPRFDLDKDIKVFEEKLNIPNQKLQAILRVHARKTQGFHSPVSNLTVNSDISLKPQKQITSSPAIKVSI